MKSRPNKGFLAKIVARLSERRSSLERRYHRQRMRRYWYHRQRLLRIRFWLANRAFTLQRWARSQRDGFSIFGTLLRAIFPQMILAVVLVLGLEVLAFALQQWLAPVAQDAEILQRLALSASAYGGLATGVVELTGAFLALYFAAVTVVASTVYAEVADDVRRLLVEEAFGNFYFRIVALSGVIAILVSGMLGIGYVPSVLILLLLIFLAAFSILSFVVLGLKTLNFFNPTPLLNYLDRDFLMWSMAATPTGLMWHDESFQHHYQRQAERTLRTYQNVIALVTSREGLGAEPVMETVKRAQELMVIYAGTKQQIPTESYWFRRKGEFPDWLLADYHVVNIALSTGTGIQQKPVPNLLWVEEEFQEVLCRGVEELISNQDWNNLVLILNTWQNALGRISTRWGVQEAESLFIGLQRTLFTAIVLPDERWQSGIGSWEEELGMRLSVLDVYQLAYIQIVLGFAKRVGDVQAEGFGEWIGAIDWKKRQNIYQTSLPREIVKELEYLYDKLELEYAAEGSHISPAWYLQQWVATKFAGYVVEVAQGFIQQIDALFVKETEKLIDENSLVFAAHACSRGIEAVEKGRLCLHNAQQCLEELSVHTRPFGFHLINTKWPDVDWDLLSHRLTEIRERISMLWSKTIPSLMMLPKSKSFPDMFGQACTELAVGCLDAMVEGREEAFAELFKAYFLSALVASERLFDELQDREAWFRFNLGIDPIIDVLEISGYALVYTELGFGDYWATAKSHWDWLFRDLQEGKSRLERIEAFLSYRASRFVSTPRDMIRTGWKQAFGAHMRARGLGEDFSARGYFGVPSKLDEYPPVVQVLLGHGIGGIPFYDLSSVFLAVYFDKDSPSPGFRLPRRAREFRRSLTLRQESKSEEESR